MSSGMSKGFFEFVKSIGESKSYQEEARIVEHEMEVLKQRMAEKSVDDRKMREYLIRMIYCEMLGHTSSFGHIHAVKFTRTQKLAQKRVGYLACTLCLHKDHELLLLLVGGLQTDLQSANMLEVATALTVLCKLVNVDTIPAVLPLVVKLLDHKEANIRKKAVMVLHRFHELDEASVPDILESAKRLLCDKDPSVMGSSLHLMAELVETLAIAMKDLVPSFVSILKQIIEHRLPKDYDYHRMPAPWMQINLLQILARLGHADINASEGMYEVLHETLRRADIGINVGYAIIYECVKTITHIYPNPQLLGETAKCTSRFITSDNHNLKYMGVNALASIVQVNPKYVTEHQMVVIDCLEDPDETLRRKTLDLLFKMTNPDNVEVVIEKLLASLKDSVDVYLRKQLVSKITKLAESYSPDSRWYVETMNDCFTLAGDLIDRSALNSMMSTISESIEDGDDDDFVRFVVDSFLELLEKPRIASVFLPVILWSLGEYSHQFYSSTEILERIWETLGKRKTTPETLGWGLGATLKLMAHSNAQIPEDVLIHVKKLVRSANTDLTQRAQEIIHLNENRGVLACGVASMVTCQELDIDNSMSFLNNFVETSLSNGAREYMPPDEQMLAEEVGLQDRALKYEAYVAPVDRNNVTVSSEPAFTKATDTGHVSTSEISLRGKTRKWGAPAPAPKIDPEIEKDESDAEPEDMPEAASSSANFGSLMNDPVPVSSQPKEEVMTEKQHMANALFGGGSKRSGKGGRKSRTSRTTRTRKKAPPKNKHVAKATVLKTEAKPAAQPTSAPDNLLDLGSLTSTPKPIQQQQQSAPKPAPVDDLLGDLFGPATTNTSAPKPVASMGGMDLLGSFGAPSNMSAPTGLGSLIGSTALQIPPSFQTILNSCPKAFDSEVNLIDDQNIRVCYNLSLSPTSKTSVTLFIVNKTNSSLSNVQIQANPGNCLQAGFDRKGVPSPSLMKTTIISIPEVSSGSTSAQLLHVGAGQLSTLGPAQVQLQMSYSCSGQNKNHSCIIPITITDLIRPARINVNQFGQNWTNLPQAQSISQAFSSTSITTPQQYSERLTKKQFLVIQVRGAEVIAAGQIRSQISADICPCLVHARVQGGIQLQVKTPTKGISAGISNDLKKLLM